MQYAHVQIHVIMGLDNQTSPWYFLLYVLLKCKKYFDVNTYYTNNVFI